MNVLPDVINRYFDRAGIKAHTVRQHVYLKLRRRFLDLVKNSKYKDIKSDINPVKSMYIKFTTQSEQLKKLQELRNLKHRNGLLPSENDMRILADAHVLSQDYKVCFVTDDKDFTYFKSEIQDELHITIIELFELPHFSVAA